MKSELLRQSYKEDQLICRSVNQIKSSHNIAVSQCILFSRYRSRPMLCANLHKWGLTNHLPVILASDRPWTTLSTRAHKQNLKADWIYSTKRMMMQSYGWNLQRPQQSRNKNSAFYQLAPSVLWLCWLGGRKGIQPVKNWAVGCWHGYLTEASCRLAYGPADATATHCLLLQ